MQTKHLISLGLRQWGQIPLLLSVLALISGCASDSRHTITQPFSAKLADFKRAKVEVKSIVEKPPERFGEFLVQLESRIIAELRARSFFEKAYSHTVDSAQPSDVHIRITITGIRDVSNYDRVMWGAFAGQANIQAQVDIVENTSQKLIGGGSIEAKSSGGSVFAGTTFQAVDKTADEVIRFLLENR